LVTIRSCRLSEEQAIRLSRQNAVPVNAAGRLHYNHRHNPLVIPALLDATAISAS